MRLGIRKRKGDWYARVEERSVQSGRGVAAPACVGGNANAAAGEIDSRPGNDGVRHLGWRVGGHSHSGHHGVPSEVAGAVERHREWHKRAVRGRCAVNGCDGQSTVEFAVIMAGFLSLTVGLAALWHAFDSGMVVEHVLAIASHHIQLVAPATIADLFLY